MILNIYDTQKASRQNALSSGAGECPVFLHKLQWKFFTPVWMVKWLRKILDRLNDMLQCEQIWGLRPMWTLRCFPKALEVVNDFLQWWQLYGFSPVWCFIWSFRPLNVLTDFVHKEQLYNTVLSEESSWGFWNFLGWCFFPELLRKKTYERSSPALSVLKRILWWIYKLALTLCNIQNS